jgi:xanthine dehydrogenase accessory factor
MKDIFHRAIQVLDGGGKAVLATIIKQAGPAPRALGTKCLIMENGTLAGTIGGGLLEARTLKTAETVRQTDRPLLLPFSLKGKEVAETEMLCGGEVDVFLEPVSSDWEGHLPLFQRIVQVINRGGSGLLVTAIDPEQWQPGRVSKIFLEMEGEPIGFLPGGRQAQEMLRGQMESHLRSGQASVMDLPITNATVSLFVEPIVSDPVLYVFGGGHVSGQIAPLASRVGFQVVVIDDREDFADPGRFPEAKQVLCRPFQDIMNHLAIDENAYLVIVTRGHLHDKMVLAQALQTPARYVGMIGSRRKRDIIYQKLQEEGVSEQDLSRVHSPIGLEIGAETPEEIAVSIVAELIKKRSEI